MLETLEQYLVQQNWQSADQETSRIVTELLQSSVTSSRENKELEISNRWRILFAQQATSVLNEIDLLWREYSNSRFGFRAQADVWFNSSTEPYHLFQWGKLIFDLDACPGHLPSITRMDCVESWAEFNDDRTFTIEITFFGKTRDNVFTMHEQKVWFGEFLLYQFKPSFCQVEHDFPRSFESRSRRSTVLLSPPQIPKECKSLEEWPEQDTGFPFKRLIFWSAIAIYLFSIPFDGDRSVGFCLNFLMYVSCLFISGSILPKSVFLFGRDQTFPEVVAVYLPLCFFAFVLLGFISAFTQP